jgi:predicted transcriptional regulator
MTAKKIRRVYVPLKKSAMKEEYKVFADLRKELKNYEGHQLVDLADKAEVSYSTLYFWLDGKTQRPRLDTLSKVAKAMGYGIELVKSKKGKT